LVSACPGTARAVRIATEQARQGADEKQAIADRLAEEERVMRARAAVAFSQFINPN
jgi:ubiquinone biosynthesis protein UbiJ